MCVGGEGVRGVGGGVLGGIISVLPERKSGQEMRQNWITSFQMHFFGSEIEFSLHKCFWGEGMDPDTEGG